MKKEAFQRVAYRKNLFWGALVLFIIWMLFFDDNSFLLHRSLNREIESLRKQKDFLIKEKQKDSLSLKEMNTPQGREKFGRENYYFKRDNEDIFVIEFDTVK